MSYLLKLFKPALKYLIKRTAQKSLPKTDGSLQFKGLEQPVTVYRDKWGVPHIYAKSTKDGLSAQGFVHAQDRFWQMELYRRIATGTASAVMGKDLLETDIAIRTLGLSQIVDKDLESYKKSKVMPLLEAYAAGINQYIDSAKNNLPVELFLLKYKPEPWTVRDTLAVGRVFAFQMSHGWIVEMDKQAIVDAVGPEKASELDIHYNPLNPPALHEGIETFTYQENGSLTAFNGPYLKPTGGSNNWSVAPHKTKTGKPFLCNDPHLPLTLPGVWFENHVDAPDFKITGISIPGNPGIMVGHNENIAWGATLAFADIQDTYIEEFTDDSLTQYKYKGKKKATTIREEVIEVHKGKPYRFKVYETHHGPVISDILNYPNKKVTLCSNALKSGSLVEGILSINQAENWDDFVRSIKYITSPSLNLAYADVKGNIGYWMTGQVPLRKKECQGNMLPKNGSSGDDEWLGNIPFEEMPHAFNPAKGYVLTCNNKIVPDDFPHYISNLWMNGYRAKRLEQLLDVEKLLSTEDFKQMQSDLFCISGLELASQYNGLTHPKSSIQKTIELLLDWDGVLTADSVGGCIYHMVRKSLVDIVVRRQLDQKLTEKFIGIDPIENATPFSEYFGHDITALLRMLNDENSWWVNQAGGRKAVLLEAAELATRTLRVRFGPNQKKWQWGKLHNLTFTHAFAQKQEVFDFLNIGTYAIGGDPDTACQMSWKPQKPFDGGGEIVGPSYRQIIDLGNFSNSVTMLVPGQSGNPQSSHYDDQVEMLLNNYYKPMFWERKDVEENAKHVLELTP